MSNALLEVQGLKTYFPIKGGVIRRRWVTCMPWRMCPSPSANRRRSPWWGSPAAASPPPGAHILRLIEPTEGAVRFDGEDLRALDGEAMRKSAAICS